jgi:hypothetical protein
MRTLLLLAAVALPLAACAKGGEGTSITFNASDGNTVAAADGGSGEVKLDVPGFQGKFTLPKLQVTADQFDLNGVHLYPGSTIRSLNIDAGEHKDGAVRVAFTSPASPATVRDWLMERLNKADFAVSAHGTGLTGTTDEKKPFTLDLKPAGSAVADGVITIGS